MQQLTIEDITNYVENNIGVFHQKRIDNLNKLKLDKVLSKKNPYLFRAKYILTAEEIVKSIVEAFISSSEEGIFGEFLEGLAIFVNSKVYNGKKSSAEGIDLEFENNDIKYIVSIKSGPNWGNSSQVAKMRDNFKKAKRILGTNTQKINIVSVNGCCYGRDNQPDKSDHLKLCGQKFWAFISGNENFYMEILDPLAFKAKEKNEEYLESYSRMVNKFTREFSNTFCTDEGNIDWEKIVRFNSSETPPIKKVVVKVEV